ncbi:hypothetical protein MKEN_01031600 [Mycena kentingensis (nom. inval.)]|nr:hypothetical protein MKEN_01031600 [Mycena kentingensis (nom. inval.)]
MLPHRQRMASLLHLLCCCSSRASPERDDDAVDERSRLIPSDLDATSGPTVGYTDHERMQERLVTIVRAKERKMVSVVAHVPFNLHNRPNASNPSRSVSLSLGRPEVPAFEPRDRDREPLTVQLRAEPSPSEREREREREYERARHASASASVSHSRDREPEPPQEPILNVRLVQTPNVAVPQRVGRPRHRAYRSGSGSRRNTNTDTGSTTSSPIAPSPPDVKPLNEICWSWGDGDASDS